MTQIHHVVIKDPSDEYWEGAIVESEVAHVLRARRVVTLPIERELLARSPVAGYYRRAWGSGWQLSTSIPKMHCSMMLYACTPTVPGQGLLHFAARLVPDPEFIGRIREGERPQGAIRIAAESGQPYAHSAGFTPSHDTCVEMHSLPALDEDDGWTVYGGGVLNVPGDGLFACALYGAAAGVRVAWLAISQSG